MDAVLSLLSDDQIADAVVTLLAPALIAILAYLARASKGFLSARAAALTETVLERLVERAVLWATQNDTPSEVSRLSRTDRVSRIEDALGYISQTKPDLVRKIGSNPEEWRLRLTTELARHQRWAREGAAKASG